MKVPDRNSVPPEVLRQAEDLAARLSARVKREMEPLLARTVLPVMAKQDRRDPVVCGTGALLRIADRSFFVTAAHVLALKLDGVVDLHVGVDGEWTRFLEGTYMALKDDRQDVGVVGLSTRMVSLIEAGGRYDFLRLSQVLSVVPTELPFGGYLLYGYPSASAETTDAVLAPQYLAYQTRPWDGPTDNLPSSYDPTMHALFYRPELPQEVEGMSGAPVWLTYKFSKQLLEPEKWSLDWARVVGIQVSEFRRAGIVKVVAWPVVLGLIAKSYPDLRAAIGLVRPYPLPR